MILKPAIVTKVFENWNFNWVGEIIFVSTHPHEPDEVNHMLKCVYYEFEPKSYTKGYKIDWVMVSNPDSSFWKLLQ